MYKVQLNEIDVRNIDYFKSIISFLNTLIVSINALLLNKLIHEDLGITVIEVDKEIV